MNFTRMDDAISVMLYCALRDMYMYNKQLYKFTTICKTNSVDNLHCLARPRYQTRCFERKLGALAEKQD